MPISRYQQQQTVFMGRDLKPVLNDEGEREGESQEML